MLDEPFSGMRVVEVKADRSTLRRLHASIKARCSADRPGVARASGNLNRWWQSSDPRADGAAPKTLAGRVIRGARIVVLVLVTVMTASAVLLVAGAGKRSGHPTDTGVAAAEVLSAGRGGPPSKRVTDRGDPDR